MPSHTRFAGMVGASTAYVLSFLHAEFKTILAITASTSKAEMLKNELEFFSKKEVVIFPAPEVFPIAPSEPSKEVVGARMKVLERLARGDKLLIVSPAKAVMHKTITRSEVGSGKCEVGMGERLDLSVLNDQLVALGYKRLEIVGEAGEFAVRGGIMDIFPLNANLPIRVEFSGDKIESLRTFDPYSQRSLQKLDHFVVLPAHEDNAAYIFDHLPSNALVAIEERMEIDRVVDGLYPLVEKFAVADFSAFVKPEDETRFLSAPSYVGRQPEIPAGALIISRHAPRLREELGREVQEGSLRGGFMSDKVEILSDKELFGEEVVLKKKKPALKEGVAGELLADLKPGDFVVHENYGIALYRGTANLEIDGLREEYLLLEFAEGSKVYLPPTLSGMVEKYASGGEFKPKLSRLGSMQWVRTKSKIKKHLRDMTQELLALYAARAKYAGFAFPSDDIWQKELEGTFPFDETPDQARAIAEVRQDMESVPPMDRLVCGDVGYGKTEVAIRAAAKAAASGKQVAVLVPTTILAEQHYNNFKNRFSSTPFVIEMLSRFKSKSDQAAIVKALSGGGVDIVIGTHRLLSKDIKFKDLGLLVIDEEQRFGVAHKEKLKKLRQTVDVLTLSATPIPRTLYLSLSGARDMSVIGTPPVDRSPVKTYVLPWNEAIIQEAILYELDRGGQVYFVHNVVETIAAMASKIKKMVPSASVAVGHGQMDEKMLEKTMLDFMAGRYNVLVCTSIIESGLDISNVNTILIDSADRFGLSQLYQIRGRVGRSAVRAYAYLFYHPARSMTDQAVERLKAIQEFTALGSGYKLAMRDLEIRGAGNLLGAEQSGHIAEVGFDLYCELLEEVVKEVKGQPEISPREVEIDLKIEAYIPNTYIADDRQRIAVYRRMNLLVSKQELEDLGHELIDRFGPLPPPLQRLFELLQLKIRALPMGVKRIKEEDGNILIEKFNGDRKKIEIKGGDRIKLVLRGIAG